MKKLILITTLMLSQAFAGEALFGTYLGKDKSGDTCTLTITKDNDIVEYSIGFATEVFNKTVYEFSVNINHFLESATTGNIDAANIDENPWTDYYHIEEIYISVEDDMVTEAKARVKDERWWRKAKIAESICTELEKVISIEE